MRDVELLVFVLELFIIRCKNKLSKGDLKVLRSEIIGCARRSPSLEEFKSNLKFSVLCGPDDSVHQYMRKFLLYLLRFEGYIAYILHDIDKIKCYEV